MPDQITYGVLENALVQLGFDVTAGPNYRSYCHVETETTIVIPDYPPEQAADEMRLATVRTMVVARGIARPERLEHLFRVPLDQLGTVAAKRSSVRITHQVPAEVKA